MDDHGGNARSRKRRRSKETKRSKTKVKVKFVEEYEPRLNTKYGTSYTARGSLQYMCGKESTIGIGRWLPPQTTVPPALQIESRIIIKRIGEIKHEENCGSEYAITPAHIIVYPPYEETFSWYMHSPQAMVVKRARALIKEWGFSKDTKDMLRDIFRALCALHEKSTVHDNLTKDDIVVMKTHSIIGRQYEAQVTDSLIKFDLQRKYARKSFQHKVENNWNHVGTILESALHDVRKFGVLACSERNLISELQCKFTCSYHEILERFDKHPAIWSDSQTETAIKDVNNAVQSGNIKLSVKDLLGFRDDWRKRVPLDFLKNSEQHRRSKYKSSAADLVGFVRNVFEHESDYKILLADGGYNNIDSFVRFSFPLFFERLKGVATGIITI